jgi:hypothetical protein
MVRRLIQIIHLTGPYVLKYILYRVLKIISAIFTFICTQLMPGVKLISNPSPLIIYVAQQPILVLDGVTVDFSRSHTVRHTYNR